MKKVTQALLLLITPMLLCCSKDGSEDVPPSPSPTDNPSPKPNPSHDDPDTPDAPDTQSVEKPVVTVHDWGNDGKDYGGKAE